MKKNLIVWMRKRTGGSRRLMLVPSEQNVMMLVQEIDVETAPSLREHLLAGNMIVGGGMAARIAR